MESEASFVSDARSAELDREHVYPPDKWGKPAGPPQGPPYEVKPVEPWPAEVNRRLAHLEKLVHKLMNPEEKRDLQSDFELY